MSYLKTLLSKDVIVTPFRVNKQFVQAGFVPKYNQTGASNFDGRNISYPLNPQGEEGTGSKSLVYNSVKQLYFSNYLGSNNPEGRVSSASLPEYNPDGTITGPRYTPNYINNVQSINERRYFPTESGDQITVLSIPQNQFGEYIQPGSFNAVVPGVQDDGEGNLVFTGTERQVGNIIYEAGLIIYYNETGSGGIFSFLSPSWKSTVTIYETQYKCTIRANEFNYSLNPSLLSSSIRGKNNILNSGSAQYADFVTGSEFSPYVTTVGLYNDEQELLAVAKLAQPLPTSQTTDTTILINIDR